MFYGSMIQSFCTKDKPLTKIFPISTKLKDIYSKTYKNNGLSSDVNSNDQKNYYKKIKIGIATSALLSLSFAALIYPLITGKGQKLLNNLIIWADTSENSIIKAARSILLNPKINIENIDQKAVAHMFTAIDNFDGLGKNGVNGAHHLYAFIKSFYKTTIKDNIQITSIKMRDKKIKTEKLLSNILLTELKKLSKQTLKKVSQEASKDYCAVYLTLKQTMAMLLKILLSQISIKHIYQKVPKLKLRKAPSLKFMKLYFTANLQGL